MRRYHPDEVPGSMTRLIDEVHRRDEERFRLQCENEVLRGMLGESPEVSVGVVVLNHVYHRYLHHLGDPHWDHLLDAMGCVIKKLCDGDQPTIEEWRSLDGWPAAITLDSTRLPDAVVFAFLDTIYGLRSDAEREDQERVRQQQQYQ